MGVTVPRSLALDGVSTAERSFTFRQPVELEVGCEDGVWSLIHTGSGLNSYGESLEEALERFAADVVYAWDTYVLRDDDELGKAAVQTKLALLDLVAETTA
jgi:hypothetical protein